MGDWMVVYLWRGPSSLIVIVHNNMWIFLEQLWSLREQGITGLKHELGRSKGNINYVLLSLNNRPHCNHIKPTHWKDAGFFFPFDGSVMHWMSDQAARVFLPSSLHYMHANSDQRIVPSSNAELNFCARTVNTTVFNNHSLKVFQLSFGGLLFLPAALAAWSWDGLECCSCSGSCSGSGDV